MPPVTAGESGWAGHDGAMPAATSVQLITGSQQRLVASRLWQLYRHDLSEFRGTMPGADGLFSPGRLPDFLDGAGRCSYLIRSGPAPAGFALVRGLAGGPAVMGEFFVVRAARRQRVGYSAAMRVLSLHPGPWEIAFQEENPGAARFWRRVAADVAAMSGTAVREERRPVPGKPGIPPDTWLLLEAARAAGAAGFPE